jgi:CheY-like chemotaxis protein
MRLLLVDDNIKDMKEFCDEVKTIDIRIEIDHIHNLRELESIIEKNNKYDGIILDLMFPPILGIDAELTESGYLGGLFLYEKYLYPNFKNIPFIVYTAMDDSTQFYRTAVEKLSNYKECVKFFRKPSNTKDIILALMKGDENVEHSKLD